MQNPWKLPSKHKCSVEHSLNTTNLEHTAFLSAFHAVLRTPTNLW